MSVSTSVNTRPFDWKRFPETEKFLDRMIHLVLNGNSFCATLSERMTQETGTRFLDWVDHLVLSDRPGLTSTLEQLGYTRDWQVRYGLSALVFRHDGGHFPRLVVESASGPEVREVAIKVDSVAEFSRAHDLGLDIQGYAYGPYRVGRVIGSEVSLAVVERRGYRGFEAYDGEMAREGRLAPHAARDALAARDLWAGRRRRFEDDSEGFDVTFSILERVLELCHDSTDLACHLVFEAERAYWESRNRAAQIQKQRQDRLGLGWSNHDHHTFRCSRKFFSQTMKLFQKLGFQFRERFQAGDDAGWGAQILEHPTTGIVIFADLDLATAEAGIDFSRVALQDLRQPSTIGLWVGLHGESILEAGMHHLEAQFDFAALRSQLESEFAIRTMPPFSDFPFLKQAFTEGERWTVDRRRADRLRESGSIDQAQHQKFLTEGAIGSHLENLERREGFKGFNQQSISAILQATDPRSGAGSLNTPQ